MSIKRGNKVPYVGQFAVRMRTFAPSKVNDYEDI